MSNHKSNYQNKTSCNHFLPYSKSELGDKLGIAPEQRGSGRWEARGCARIILSKQRASLTMRALARRHKKEEGKAAST